MITVIKGDITRLDFDVIVCAANTSLTPVGHVAKAIFDQAGYRLQDACQRLHGCHTGEAKMTLSYNLPCQSIIHTVGPIYSGTKKDEEYLEACYWNSISLAYEFFKLNHLKQMTLAFSSISTGTYGFPKDKACQIAVQTIQKIMNEYKKARDIDVIFVCDEEEDYLLYKEALKKMKSIVEYSHAFLRPVLHRQAYCIDATLGRGKDSSFFLKEGVRKVFAFEIQEEIALETKEKIKDDRLELYLMSHENIDQIHHEIDAIIFNFGYCPNGNPEITTQVSSSLMAVKKGLSLLKRKGRMALVFYPHEQGLKEAKEIEAYLKSLDSSYEIIQIKKWNQQSPYLIGIEKK